MDASTSFNSANEALQRGDLAQARSICDGALRLEPGRGDLWHLSALIACRSGAYEDAIGRFERSLAANPRQAAVHANLGGALVMLQRSAEAVAHCERALVLQPGFADAHYSRGCAFLALERHREAVADFDRVLQAAAGHVPALMNRGNALHRLGSLPEALASFDRVLVLRPGDAGALYNRGNALRDLGRYEDALDSYERVLALGARSADLDNNRGNVLRRLRRYGAALEAYQASLQLKPGALEPLNNCGLMLLELGRIREALACFDQALMQQPDFAPALDGRASALQRDRRFAEAALAYATLAKVQPDFKGAALNLHFARAMCCDWSEYAPQIAAAMDSVRRGIASNPFSLLAATDDAGLQRRGAYRFSDAEGWLAAQAPFRPAARAGERIRRADQRIKLAYVSADFRQHPVSILLAGVLEQHDRQRFEVIGVSLHPEDDSVLGARVRAAFDQWIDVTRMSDGEAAARMREAGIDIAIDLMGFTGGSRPGIFAARCAPAQVNYLGYPGGMGVPFIDYIIADEFVIPRSTADSYAERPIYLPDCFQPNDDRRARTAAPSRTEAGLPAEGLVLCSFNNSYKFNPPMFDIWMRLLSAVPDSVLWLAVDDLAARDNLRREAESRGVDAQRLVLAPRMTYEQHLGRLKLADLFLDTLPFNAGTTASDALWAGVPVLTCTGEAFASRMAGSLLRTVGLSELITHSLPDYERLALELCRQPQRLRQLREHLETARDRAALFDTAGYCRHLEAAYTAMHRAVLYGEKPADIRIETQA
jgi:protein O-GlcNAc transferase